MIEQRDILILSICTVITVFAWIVFDVYHAAATSQITQVQQKLIFPLDPTLDASTLETIKTRLVK